MPGVDGVLDGVDGERDGVGGNYQPRYNPSVMIGAGHFTRLTGIAPGLRTLLTYNRIALST